MNLKEHWNLAYTNKPLSELGWYKEQPEPSMELIRSLNLSRYAEIINVGSGSSNLIEYLLEDGFQNITVNDISPVAMGLLKNQLGKEECNVEWMLDDLIAPSALRDLPPIDLWHDRGVFHFFTEEKDQLTYVNLLKQKVKSKGYVIIAAFSKEGTADVSCGLPIVKCDEHLISDLLGYDFQLKRLMHYTFVNPDGGERPYIYTLYQRK